jgi:uncharacterized RDD family membrane protein YckC
VQERVSIGEEAQRRMNETKTDLWSPTKVFGKFLFSPTLGQRSLAMLIDLALVSLLQVGASQVFGVYQPLADSSARALINGDGFYLYVGQATTIAFLWLAIIVIAYFTGFEAVFGATPGKALLRLHVVMLDGGRPSFGAILMRNVLRLVDVLPAFYIVGALVAESTLHEQRVGDIVAGTIVVARPSSGGSPAGRLRLKLLLTAVTLAALVVGCLAFQYLGRPPLIIQSWANANNSYLVASGASSASAQACGPLPRWPDPIAASNVASGSEKYAPRPILQYALGAPTWSAGKVTYPIYLQVWNDATDSGALPTIPNQVSVADVVSGPDVYTGHVTLSWVGPLKGGWQITGGDMSCSKAG